MQNLKTELIQLTSHFVNRPDCIQGPGGNTSVKDDKIMYIKASGMRFEEMNENNGISAVSYLPIVDFLSQLKLSNKEENEIQLLSIVESNRLLDENQQQYPKPSMETGFHAALKKYVVHTHSVWTNLFNCAENRLELIEQLKTISDLKITELPFVSPGLNLSYLVNEKVLTCQQNNEAVDDVFLLANHGVIAHSDKANHTVEMLEKLDKSIAELLKIDKQYPPSNLISIDENVWQPKDTFVADTIKKIGINKAYFDRVLFPDQIVFFKDNISDLDDKSKKISLNNGDIIYRCGEREAISIHETMTAYLFLQNQFLKLNLEPKLVIEEEIEYINNMAMEKHRKNLM